MNALAAILASLGLCNSTAEYQPLEFFTFTNSLRYAQAQYWFKSNIVGAACQYVPEQTNVWKWGEFAVFRNGVETNCPPPDIVEDLGDDKKAYYDVSGSILESGPDVEARPNHITCGRNCWQIGPWHAVSNGVRLADYVAERPYEIERVKSGNWIHRGMLPSEGALAAVYNTFGGYYERMYYASQGQSNVWNTAHFGPTNRQDFQSMLWDYQPTNRNVRTRRLFEADNVLALREQIGRMIPRFCSDDGASFVYRPGWIADPSGSSAHLAWWSSRQISCLPCVGAFDWRENIFDSISRFPKEWSKSAICLGHLKARPEDPRPPMVWKTVLEDMLFDGDPLRDRLDEIEYPKTVSFEGLVSNIFPHASGKFRPESTRRLFPEDLALVNQTLSLMDITYHIPEVGDYTNGLVHVYINKGLIRKAEKTVSLDYVDGQYVLSETVRAKDLHFSTVTNYTTVYEETMVGRSDREQLRIGATHTDGPTIICSVNDGTALLEFAADASFAQRISSELSYLNGKEIDCEIRFTLMDTTLSSLAVLEVRIVGTTLEPQPWMRSEIDHTFYFAKSIPTDNVKLSFTEGCRRGYSRAHKAYRRLKVGPTQPGKDTKPSMLYIDPDTGVRPTVFAFLATLVDKHSIPDTLNTFIYQPGKTTAMYKLSAEAFDSRQSLLGSVDDQHLELRGEMQLLAEAHCGANPWDHAAYLPLDAGIFADAEDKATFSHVLLNLVRDGSNSTVRVKGTIGGRIDVVKEIGGEDVSMLGATLASIVMSVPTDGDTPSVPQKYADRPSFAADGLFEVVTVVPWQWRSMIIQEEEE